MKRDTFPIPGLQLPAAMSFSALWKKKSPKSKSEADTGSPSMSTWRSSMCQPRGRTMRVAVFSSSE